MIDPSFSILREKAPIAKGPNFVRLSALPSMDMTTASFLQLLTRGAITLVSS